MRIIQFSKKNLVIATAVIVAIATVTFYLVYQHRHIYVRKYSQLYTYSLPNSQNHSGMSLLVPLQLRQSNHTIVNGNGYALLEDKKIVHGQATAISEISLSSIATKVSANDLSIISLHLNQTSSANPIAVTLPLQNSASSLLNSSFHNPTYNLTFSAPKKIGSLPNSWFINFTAKATKSGTKNTPPRQGTAIEVYGSHGQYYVAISAVSTNWQANPNVWPQIINSLKIDQ